MSRRVGILVLKLAPDALAYSKSRDETWPIRFRGIETMGRLLPDWTIQNIVFCQTFLVFVHLVELLSLFSHQSRPYDRQRHYW